MLTGKVFQIVLVWAMILAAVSIGGCKKNEHPTEHPTEHPAEHPSEHPTGGAKSSPSKEELADAVEAYVNKTAAAEGGYFVAFDEKAGQQLKLTLDKVHRERLSKVGEDLYFACADFKTPEGKVYDLDVFMKGPDKDSLTFSKFTIHKEAGKERYTWYEQGGIWKTKPIGGVVGVPKEHPKEHPK
jgi:hypothetical protein